MYFMQNARPREMEIFMQRAPHFRPRGCGVIAIRITEIPPSTFAGVMMKTASAIRYRPFQLRLQQYLKESKDSPMIYKNDKHRAAFEAAVRKENKKNDALLSALYLLTADCGETRKDLWLPAASALSRCIYRRYQGSIPSSTASWNKSSALIRRSTLKSSARRSRRCLLSCRRKIRQPSS